MTVHVLTLRLYFQMELRLGLGVRRQVTSQTHAAFFWQNRVGNYPTQSPFECFAFSCSLYLSACRIALMGLLSAQNAVIESLRVTPNVVGIETLSLCSVKGTKLFYRPDSF
jgi:hypothetical protein